MYTYEKKMPVKNTIRKNLKRNDGQVRDNRVSRYYLDDARGGVKSSSANVVQRVLFADIPIGDDGQFNYKDIKEMQVWWFMACEWKKQSELRQLFTPERHLKSLRTLLTADGLKSFNVEGQDRVRLASHGDDKGRILITDNRSGEIQECNPDEVMEGIKEKTIKSGEKQVDADYCYITRSGLPITRESQMYSADDLRSRNYDGPTISGVGKTWLLNGGGLQKIYANMKSFKTTMTEGIGFKTVEDAKADFPRLSDYLEGGDVQLDDVLKEIYQKGKLAMNAFTNEVKQICDAYKISYTTIEGIWGDSID